MATATRRRQKIAPPPFLELEQVPKVINMMVYGPSGAGKTRFLCEQDDILILSAEPAGTESGILVKGKNCKVAQIKKWSDMEATYNWIYDNIEDLPFKWIAVDSLNRLERLGMKAQLLANHRKNPTRSLYVPAQQDYLVTQSMLTAFTEAFIDLPVNVVFTCLARQETDVDGNDFMTPDIQGSGYQLSQKLAGLMSCYGYLHVIRREINGKEREVRRITWRDTGKIRGKDRHNVLAPYTDNKSLRELDAMIQAGPQAKKTAPRRTRRTTRRRVAV